MGKNRNTGWLRWEAQASIHNLAMTAYASQTIMYKYFGFRWPKTILIYRGTDVVWSNNWDDIYKFGAEIIDFYKDLQERRKYISDRQKAVDKLFKTLDEIERLDLKRLANKDLFDTYKKFCDVYLDFWKIAWLDEPVAFECERILENAGVGAADMAILLAPSWKAFVAEIEADLFKIKKTKASEQDKLMKLHLKKYFWKRNNYLRSYNITAQDIKRELKTVGPVKNKVVSKKQALLKLPSDLREIVSIMDDFGRFQDERKMQMMVAVAYMEKLLLEIGKRVGLSLDDMRYTYFTEVDDLLFSKKKLKAEILKRKKKCVLAFDGDRFSIDYGGAVDKVEKELFGSDKTSTITKLVGQTASSGTAIGKAVILKSPKEVNRLKEGDILVAPSTSPDYVIAMRKAGAVVTDWGGMTSHAAIISREFGIPCIVGTERATKIFKDGDVVEVNADEGWVKKLSNE